MSIRLLLGGVVGVVICCICCIGPGCVEVDTDQASQQASTTTSCGKGDLDRKAVAPDMLAALHSCCDGRGHLVPAQLVPDAFRSWLKPGPTDETVCVPDEIATDASWSPAPCASVMGLDGACISTCIPMVTEQAIELPQDVCGPNQRCAPCIHPQTLEVTGACDVGERACTPYKPIGNCDPFSPTLDLSKFAACCADGPAHCAAKDLVTGSVGGLNIDSMLGRCPDKSYCVPDDLLARAGRYQPAACRSLGDREGRCLSVCVKAVSDEKDLLPQASCKSGERCVPCYDPRGGAATGACTLGPCDKPKEPARPFEPCGVGQDDASCVPTQLVPASEACNFDAKGCGKGCSEPNTLCVPKKAIAAGAGFEGKKCTASLPGLLAWFSVLLTDPGQAATAATDYADGRCMSQCLPAVQKQVSSPLLKAALTSTECDADEVCVPCYDPMRIAEGKISTGACWRDPCPGTS